MFRGLIPCLLYFQPFFIIIISEFIVRLLQLDHSALPQSKGLELIKVNKYQKVH